MCYILEIKEMFGMDSNKTPSEIIAELCVEAGISKSELARRLEITPSQITRILNGDTKTISSDILIKLTKLFGVSADYLLGITDKKEIIKEKHTTRVPMLLMSSAFPLGRCIEFIESIDDVPQKEMAYAEYYYFSGRHEKAVEYAEMYLNCEDIMLKLSASLIYTFANLSLDRIHSARFGLERLKEYLKEAMLEETDKKTRACCVFVATAAHTLLHIPVGDLPPLAEYLSEFTKGMQLWGAYVLAHKAYLVKDYQRSLGIVQTCLMTCSKVYPIAMIYLNLVVAMDLMNLKETDKAKVYFMKVWEISRPDNLIEGIGEHHGLLQGLIETCMKKDYPEDYARIINITYKFSAGWRRIHNPDTNEDVADNLTTTEFTIAMLANRGWTNKEISEYLEITPRTVKQHLTCVFNKLNIENRKQLKNFMLR
ncbi:putative addiction module antidote protein HigA [Eubacterium ventriosum ATCC 27560]|jgi:DNA-binding CsgD family transcriptional regulator|uniref:Helix-turn-helix domain-containing protein n=4 Tax=Eubacterium ventriosum TaxID=39496 RepID=A0A414R9C6_9FIRM|nr:putative addiction module antidote protein HigA [Eubacterium ventriosum ATCC 27560]RHF89640.1 helix-turn-helix domain-containing protein [Eubacterium ventriosum]